MRRLGVGSRENTLGVVGRHGWSLRRVQSIAEMRLQEVFLGWRSLSIGILESLYTLNGGRRGQIRSPHSGLQQVR